MKNFNSCYWINYCTIRSNSNRSGGGSCSKSSYSSSWTNCIGIISSSYLTMWITITLLTFCFLSTSAGVSSSSLSSQSSSSSSSSVQQFHHLNDNHNQQQHLNLSTFVNELESSCPSYCEEQIQFNSLCVNQGCKQWRNALTNGCGAVCNGSEANFRQFYACQVGCSKIVEDYYYHVTALIGVPDPPTLISDSLQSTSLQLSWEGSTLPIPYLVFTIQRRFYLRNHPWESLPTEPLNQTTYLVQGLKPYTEYQFRVGWILAQDFPPYYSLESNPIETLPRGLPNKPEITSVQSISNSSVAVTWLAPSQLNGRLVAYILKLQNTQHGHVLIKEIPMSQNPRGYTFSGLLPNTNYSLSISAQNLEGEGSAATISFVTPQSSISNDISKKPEPKLLLQGIHDVYIQQLEILLEPDVSVFISNQNVTAMAAHFKYKWIFVATADGQVIRTGLERNDSVVLLSPEKLDITVQFLSVDWLHDKLYLVGKKKRSTTWCIKKCEFNGEKLQTVYPNLGAQPLDFVADPYTGYLYWVTPPSYILRGGLYKMDIVGEDHNGVPPPVIAVLEGADLGPFTIDFANYRILIVHKTKNTVYSISLDGEVVDIRQNTQSPQFEYVHSIGMYNGIFYGTTGRSVVIEEYNAAQDSYYHNSYDIPKTHQPCTRLIILHPDLQPTPIPMAPPQLPQGVFSQKRARIIWKPPTVIAGLGEGHWKDWKYQIRMSDNTTISNITGTEYTLGNLRPSTFYSIQILAYSEGGQSPLSQPFRGRTLRETAYNISLFWGSESGLYSTDALGENVQRFISPSQWRNPNENWSISTMTWHENSIFFATTNGTVFHYNNKLSSGSSPPTLKRLRGISFAQSLAFDYIGEKLYWSNPKKQSIFYCSLNDINSVSSIKLASERLEIVTTAKELVTDSYKALLLWTTGHSIEMSRLNGYHHTILHSVGIFSGIRIMGITLDTEQWRIYWISRSSLGSSLMRLNYNTKSTQMPSVLANLEDVSITGPIRYFSDRLIWLQDSSEAVTTDINGQGRSSMKIDSINNITNINVKDQFAQRYPPGLSRGKINVHPNSVPKWSIIVSGKWNDFTISWQSVNNTNFGRIFYEITVNNYVAKPTAQSFITITNGTLFKPYTEIEISITSLTYWIKSDPTNVTKQTPSAKPSEPLNPRIYLQKSETNENIIIGELRWNLPIEPNGKILGYLVHCWKDSIKTSNCFCQVDLNTLSCSFKSLQRKSTYEFAVQAYTDAGAGNLSRKILCNTEHSNPVPKLLLSSLDKIQVFDIDRNELKAVPSGYLTPTTVTYLYANDLLFWFNEGQDLMTSKLDGTNKTRILSLINEIEVGQLTVDWIGRKLYWIAEFSTNPTSIIGESEERYRIMSLDLSDLNAMPEVLIKSRAAIKSITINPFKGLILWTSQRRSGILTLNSANIHNGNSIELFLSKDSVNCNCSRITLIGEVIAFDPNGHGNIERGILINDHQSIWLADEFGCMCHQIVNMSSYNANMNPPYSIATDDYHIYWTTNNNLYTSDKYSQGITELEIAKPFHIKEVSVLGSISQPFPELNCLVPRTLEPREPLLFNHSSHSLHLQMPTPIKINCSFDQISMATVKYDVYYGTVDENGITECTPSSLTFCKIMKSTDPLVRISNLHPYTTYTVFVMIKNYYTEQNNIPPLVCSPIMLRTAPGAPMPPKLLRVVPLTPASARVVWGRPEKLNGEKVWYEVYWKSITSPNSNNQNTGHKWAVPALDSKTSHNNNITEYSFNVTDLQPASNYSIWVVAFSEKGDSFSESEKLTVETFPNPNNITLVSARPHTLSLVWIPPSDNTILRHQIIYRMGWSTEWNYTEIEEFTIPGHPYNITITNLKPKTLYGFRLKTWYVGDPLHSYDWPTESQFNVETLADKPSSPGVPVIRGIGKSLYEIAWDRADENGAHVDLYSLECRKESNNDLEGDELEDYDGQFLFDHNTNDKRSKREVNELGVAEKIVTFDKSSQRKNQFSEWKVIYNGSEPRWQVKNLDINAIYSFRCRASNIYGWGSYSEDSTPVSMAAISTVVAEPQNVGLILGVIALALFILVPLALGFIYLYRRKQKEKPMLTNSDRREVELATLRELPAGSSFIHQSNILYAAGELVLDLDLAGVPKLSRHHITLTKFLGSGAFGEVYEGLAANLHGESEEEGGTRVAIKTLRKGATHQEKIEFIQEAKLMAQFRHPHILQLVGICIDTDPCCLLLELMDNGDLLSYLRSNRPNVDTANCLTLIDLLRMCVDVAQGCVYLEDMHFVHRDLAARNCLVRAVDVPDSDAKFTVVKIGDFGLARDVYRNDYYRKEGEGLLPVRWMAPESLVDGVFTTQSDVWSFGVLLWEIMTLGQQPYPARTNLEVLHFVRTGGRLHQPPHCPQRLSNLMLQCWEYEADNRPSFKDCLVQLEAILHDFEMDELPQYRTSYGAEGSPLQYNNYAQSSDGHPEQDDSVFFPANESPQQFLRNYMETNGNPNNLNSNYNFPKYLEVLSDSNSEHSSLQPPSSVSTIRTTSTILAPLSLVDKDGYEIPLPRKPPRNPKNINNTFNTTTSNNNRFAVPQHPIINNNGDDFGLPNPNTYWNTAAVIPAAAATKYQHHHNYKNNHNALNYHHHNGRSTEEEAETSLTTTPPLPLPSTLKKFPLNYHHNNLGNTNTATNPNYHHNHHQHHNNNNPQPRIHKSSIATTKGSSNSESETDESSSISNAQPRRNNNSHNYRHLLKSSTTSEEMEEPDDELFLQQEQDDECLNEMPELYSNYSSSSNNSNNDNHPHALQIVQPSMKQCSTSSSRSTDNDRSCSNDYGYGYERPLIRVENLEHGGHNGHGHGPYSTTRPNLEDISIASSEYSIPFTSNTIADYYCSSSRPIPVPSTTDC